MYRTIVVGTDGSPSADVAVRHATDLAKLSGATLHVVSAYRRVTASVLGATSEVGAVPLDSGTLTAEVEAVASGAAEAAAARATAEGVTAEAHVQGGEASDVILGVAEQVDADLVVVGSRGMQGARRFVLGSVPNRIAHHCGRNLLIVHTA